MADKKPNLSPSKRTEFEEAAYELGLELIEAYRTGNHNNAKLILESIIALMGLARQNTERG